MKITRQTSDYTIFARNDGRYAVRGKDKKYVNGAEKVKILLAEGLLKTSAPKPPPTSPPGAEAPSDEATSSGQPE